MDRYRTLEHLHDYWDRGRAGRPLLARANIDPVDIPTLLPFLILCDLQNDPFDVRYRLIGNHVRAYMGRNLVGSSVLAETAANPSFQPIWDTCSACAERGAPTYTNHEMVSALGHRIRHHGVILPVSTDGRRLDMLLAAVVFEGSLAGPLGPLGLPPERCDGATRNAMTQARNPSESENRRSPSDIPSEVAA